MSNYDKNLDKNKANYVPLTPLTFLERAKDVYPNYEAIVYEDRKYTWSQVYKRSVKFASALSKIGISEGDTVSFLAFNTPEIFEACEKVEKSERGEYELTDAIKALAKQGKVKSRKMLDYWLDFGNPDDIEKVANFLEAENK